MLTWVVSDSPRLGSRLRRLLGEREVLYFSPLSVVELTMKAAAGKIALPNDFAQRLRTSGFHEPRFDSTCAGGVGRFPRLHHHDPYDRILLAQAMEHQVWFETADQRLLELALPMVRDAIA